MNIVIATRNMRSGGAQRVISQLANYIVSINYKCTILTVETPDIQYPLSEKVQIESICDNHNNKIVKKLSEYFNVRKKVLDLNPNVVLTMPEDIGVYVLASLLGSGIPVVVSERNNPWVMPDVKVTRVLRKLVYPYASGFIFQTESARGFFQKSIRNKGVVLSNPVDATRIPEQYKGVRSKTIVAVGRLSKQKNFVNLINAFNMSNLAKEGYDLAIFGEGPEKNHLETYIKQLGLSNNVTLAGRKENVLELINNASMFVMSSDYEGMPNALIEAMCMGMPVISTDCPSGGPKQIINSTNGILVPVGDSEKLSQAMRLLTNEKLATETANEAYKIRKELTDESIFEKWIQFLIARGKND